MESRNPGDASSPVLQQQRQRSEELDACRREYETVRRRYDRLLESAPDALIFVDRAGKIALVNAQFEALFGYTLQEVQGRNLDILIPERFRRPHHAHLSDYLAHPRTRHMGSGLTIFGLKKNGEEFPADISLSPSDSDGSFLIAAAVRDISERRRTEALIERNYTIQRVITEILRIALEPIPIRGQLERILDLLTAIPGLALDSRGAIYLADEGSRLLRREASRGLPDVNDLGCSTIPFGHCLCGRAVESRAIIFSPRVDEHHDEPGSGEIPHGHYCVPILSGEDRLGLINVFVREGHRRSTDEEEFLGAVANTLAGIIVRYRAEQEKERLREQLNQAERFSALGRITANVADELRNPLTTVGGFARRLYKKLAAGAKEREYAEFIMSEVARLEGILRGLLAYSRARSPLIAPHDVNDLVDEALARHQSSFSAQGITVRRTYRAEVAARVDRELALEAMDSIITNALEAMPQGGVLSVETGDESIASLPHTMISIGDTGAGIPEENLEAIFEPFFTTKIAPKASGLGLSIARKIVEDHGGKIRVESTPGEGAVFSLFFPADRARQSNP